MQTFKKGDTVQRAGAGFMRGVVVSARKCSQGGVVGGRTQSVRVRWSNGHTGTMANQQLEHVED